MERLMPVAERVGALLKQRGDKVAVAESSPGGSRTATSPASSSSVTPMAFIT